MWFATHTKAGKPVMVNPDRNRQHLYGKVLAELISYELIENFHEIPVEEEDQINIDNWWSDIKPHLIKSLKEIEPDLEIITKEVDKI